MGARPAGEDFAVGSAVAQWCIHVGHFSLGTRSTRAVEDLGRLYLGEK